MGTNSMTEGQKSALIYGAYPLRITISLDQLDLAEPKFM